MGRRGPSERWGKPVRVPPDLHGRLMDEAERLGVPATWLMAKLLTEGLDGLPDQITLTRGEAAK